MSAVLLKGASSPADPAWALCIEGERQLAARFDTVRSFHLAGYDIGHCMGEFDCFVKTPGRCRIHDEGQEIERAAHDAELVVLVTPLHYGGYAAPAVCTSPTTWIMWCWTSPTRSPPKPGLVARGRPAWCASPVRAAFASRELDTATHTRPNPYPAEP